MKAVILDRNVMISGRPHVPGDKVNLPDQEAAYLVNIGKAHWPEKKAPEKETAASKAAAQGEKR